MTYGVVAKRGEVGEFKRYCAGSYFLKRARLARKIRIQEGMMPNERKNRRISQASWYWGPQYGHLRVQRLRPDLGRLGDQAVKAVPRLRRHAPADLQYAQGILAGGGRALTPHEIANLPQAMQEVRKIVFG